jgi:Relaxase/Mobilisation nuclease domain
MLARIRTSTNIRSILNYNERKLSQGKGECLLAENFIKDLDQLSAKDKLHRLLQRTTLNDRAEHNSLHISLNFGTAEIIPNKKMQELAKHYMHGVDLDRQPYLVYRHYDSGHHHLHVVSTNIRADGSQINIDPKFLGRSLQLTKAMERQYALLPNKKRSQAHKEKYEVSEAQRVEPGQTGLLRSISDVLNTVVDHYKYTNLAELNAVLHLYNVRANRGNESSHLYKHRGLLYHAMDKDGHKAGKAIKASDFLLKPTLANLEKKFVLNEPLREEHMQRVQTSIDWTLAGQAPDWQGFQMAMEKEQSGYQPGIFFVDHRTQCVFTGEDLGRQYSLLSLREKCAPDQTIDQEEELSQRLRLTL